MAGSPSANFISTHTNRTTHDSASARQLLIYFHSFISASPPRPRNLTTPAQPPLRLLFKGELPGGFESHLCCLILLRPLHGVRIRSRIRSVASLCHRAPCRSSLDAINQTAQPTDRTRRAQLGRGSSNILHSRRFRGVPRMAGSCCSSDVPLPPCRRRIWPTEKHPPKLRSAAAQPFIRSQGYSGPVSHDSSSRRR